jgi:Protein of unknown function (DUF3833)
MKKLSILFCIGAVMTLCSCSTQVDTYKDTKPEMALEEFFSGDIRAWGIVQSRSGKVMRRFDIDMHGSWDGPNGTLEEHFNYYDGKTQDRTWHITRLPDGSYEGTAADIEGKATGHVSGSAVRWSYVMDLPVDDTTYKIKFDDWMFRMNDDVVMNRSYLKKFGFKVAELTIFMQKK